jgi:hypothetical protein
LLSQDDGDINKALKMAIKSAHIDATLRMAGLSEVFTQDIEDMQARREAESVAQAENDLKSAQINCISRDQHRRLEARITELGLDRTRVKDWMIKASKEKFTSFLQLTPEFYQRLYDKLDQFAGVMQ